LRVRGRWHKYDCLSGGAVPSSDTFDADWNSWSQCIVAYLKTSLCVATPPLYTRHEQGHHNSPSGRQPDRRHHADDSSPSGRNQRRSQHSPQSPSGRSTSPCGDRSLNDRSSTDAEDAAFNSFGGMCISPSGRTFQLCVFLCLLYVDIAFRASRGCLVFLLRTRVHDNHCVACRLMTFAFHRH
ncbi:unnamed protein product, partial [Ectocarpus sp. 12 AP-2014]